MTAKLKSKRNTKTRLDKKLIGPIAGGGLWSNYVKKRAGYRCEVCGSKDNLNAHHIVSKSNKRLRYDINNGVCLCSKHHVFDNFSAHKNPVWFTEWLSKYHKHELDYIQQYQYDIKQWSVVELEELVDKFKKLLDGE